VEKTYWKLVSLLECAFSGMRREMFQLRREYSEEIAKAKKQTAVAYGYLKKADAEVDRLTTLVDEYESKLAIRDNDVAVLEIALENAKRGAGPRAK
jgi:hypothetical protein